MSLPDLRGANALLTGGSQGLGPRIAHALAARGANVALAARSADKLEAVAADLRPLGVTVAFIAADVARPEDRARLAAQAEAALGPLDLLVNNAGVELNSRFERKTEAEIDQIITTNVLGALQLTRLVLPGMLARRRGHIVNLGSMAGKLGTPFGSVYGASKAAVMAWSWALRVELQGTGVGVSSINPGLVSQTGLFAYHQTRPHILLGQVTPEAVVQAVVRAITRDEPAGDVYPWLFKTYELLNLFSPATVMRLQRLLGVRSWLKRVYDKEQP